VDRLEVGVSQRSRPCRAARCAGERRQSPASSSAQRASGRTSSMARCCSRTSPRCAPRRARKRRRRACGGTAARRSGGLRPGDGRPRPCGGPAPPDRACALVVEVRASGEQAGVEGRGGYVKHSRARARVDQPAPLRRAVEQRMPTGDEDYVRLQPLQALERDLDLVDRRCRGGDRTLLPRDAPHGAAQAPCSASAITCACADPWVRSPMSWSRSRSRRSARNRPSEPSKVLSAPS
jgi:hypothetical protein